MRRILAILLFAVFAAWGVNVKLYLKDGGFHLVREYQVQADRVRFYSVERSQWEEIPLDMVDLKRTQTEAAAREKIRAIPDGTYEAESFLDDDGAGLQNIPIKVRVIVDGDDLTVDFSEMADEVPGTINSGRSRCSSCSFKKSSVEACTASNPGLPLPPFPAIARSAAASAPFLVWKLMYPQCARCDMTTDRRLPYCVKKLSMACCGRMASSRSP